jgi:RNA recognition motif-containing protein
MPFDVTEEIIKELFNKVGTVQEVRIARNPKEGPTKGLFMGYGFIKMSSGEEVTKAVSELNGQELEGRQIHLEAGSQNEDLWERAFGKF